MVLVSVCMIIVILGRILDEDWTAAGVWFLCWIFWSRS
jgi:hypothetical protein